MTYLFELERDFERAPRYDRDGSAWIEFALGYDPERDSVILMTVLLVSGDSYMEGKISGLYDLQFGVRERNLTAQHVTPPHFSTASTSQYVPRTAGVTLWPSCLMRWAHWSVRSSLGT